MYIKTLDAIYEDMESLSNLDVTNTTIYDADMLRIARYKIYWKYITGSYKKKRIF